MFSGQQCNCGIIVDQTRVLARQSQVLKLEGALARLAVPCVLRKDIPETEVSAANVLDILWQCRWPTSHCSCMSRRRRHDLLVSAHVIVHVDFVLFLSVAVFIVLDKQLAHEAWLAIFTYSLCATVINPVA